MSGPVRAGALPSGRRDLPACALAAAALHALALCWLPAAPAIRAAALAPRSGNIAVEVSLISDKPSTLDSAPVPLLNIPEPEPLLRPREEPPPPPDERPHEPEFFRPRPLPSETPPAPEELLRPRPETRRPDDSRPPAPPSVRSGASGNRAAGISRHYIRHPDDGRRRVREGTVTLRLQVLASGRVGQIVVLGSSGDDELDRAAVRGLARAKCRPATRGGNPVDSFVEKQVRFAERGSATAD